jgi:hypothetical protein
MPQREVIGGIITIYGKKLIPYMSRKIWEAKSCIQQRKSMLLFNTLIRVSAIITEYGEIFMPHGKKTTCFYVFPSRPNATWCQPMVQVFDRPIDWLMRRNDLSS